MNTHDAHLANATERHDVRLGDEAAMSGPDDAVAYALCLCRDGRHDGPDHLAWVTTHETAWADHVYMPAATHAHVARREVRITGAEMPSIADALERVTNDLAIAHGLRHTFAPQEQK